MLDLTRRRFIKSIGLVGIAPVVVRTAGLLMPIKTVDPLASRALWRELDAIEEWFNAPVGPIWIDDVMIVDANGKFIEGVFATSPQPSGVLS